MITNGVTNLQYYVLGKTAYIACPSAMQLVGKSWKRQQPLSGQFQSGR